MDRKTVFNLMPWLLGLALVALLLPAAVAEEEKKEEKKAPEKTAEPAKSEAQPPAAQAAREKDCSEVKVFTNEDLERMFRGEEVEPDPSSAEAAPAEGAAPPERRPIEPAAGSGAAQPTDSLQWMQDREARQAERRQQIADTEAAVAAAQQRVADLEKRLLATKNPFMARPVIPDDEKEKWDSEGTKERANATEEQLSQAREELQKLEQELAQLRSQS